MRISKDKKFMRYEIVRYAETYGIKPAARAFNTTVKTVRKWFRRWEPGSMEGLEEQSKAPKNPALKITEAQRKKAIELKKNSNISSDIVALRPFYLDELFNKKFDFMDKGGTMLLPIPRILFFILDNIFCSYYDSVHCLNSSFFEHSCFM